MSNATLSSGTSKWGLWAATSKVPWSPRPALRAAVRSDVAVVGGGFTGLSTAIHVSEAGASVCVLEAHALGHGASGRNGGQVNAGLRVSRRDLERRHGDAGHRLYRMAQEAPDYLEGLVRRHGLQAGLTRHGLFKLAHSRPACRSLEADVKELQAEGVGAELLSRAELETRVGTHRYMAGAFDPRGGAVHPLDLVREYGNLLQRLGGQIFEQSRVIAIDRIGGLWHVQTPEGQVIADTIVIATNAYTDDLVAGLRQTVLPVNSFQIASSPIDDRVSETILPGGQTAHDMRRLVLYFRKTKDRRVVIGGRASFDSASEISHSADYDVLREILIDIFPTLSGATIEHRWAGLVGITTSRQPHYHSPAPGFHILLGFNGRGVALTSRAGAWLAHRILGQADTLDIPAVPLRRIPFHRFRTPLLNAAMKWHRGMDLLGY